MPSWQDVFKTADSVAKTTAGAVFGPTGAGVADAVTGAIGAIGETLGDIFGTGQRAERSAQAMFDLGYKEHRDFIMTGAQHTGSFVGKEHENYYKGWSALASEFGFEKEKLNKFTLAKLLPGKAQSAIYLPLVLESKDPELIKLFNAAKWTQLSKAFADRSAAIDAENKIIRERNKQRLLAGPGSVVSASPSWYGPPVATWALENAVKDLAGGRASPDILSVFSRAVGDSAIDAVSERLFGKGISSFGSAVVGLARQASEVVSSVSKAAEKVSSAIGRLSEVF